ncbi:MAG: histidine phosphatase family protein [Chloroflexota bacterium]|nr:histidine phosphatase family protein [Chloroflexota bacterium]
MSRIVLVRHGSTDWNEGGGERLRGRADIPLNAQGLRQADATACSLSNRNVDIVYSSPLARALATSKEIALKCGVEAQTLNALIDIDYGEWQGLSLEEARTRDGSIYSQWLKDPRRVTFPNGENLAQVQERAVAGIESIVERHLGQTTVLVSHKVLCKVLLCFFLGLDDSYFWRLEQHTCAINEIDVWGDIYVVNSLNDTCHLKDIT